MKKTLIAFLFAGFFLNTVSAEEKKSSGGREKWKEYFGMSKSKDDSRSDDSTPEGMMDLIDIPTTRILDYGGYRLNFRLYSEGGVQSHISFGVFQRLNIGAAWDVERLMGSEEARTVAPTLNVKFRVYDGSPVLPSFTIGYDGQGRFYNRTTDEYNERERGIFGALDRELFFPGLLIHAGMNIAKFKEGEVFGFTGLSYMIEDKVALLMEYDNIRKGPANRWNAGIRFFPIPSLAIDFAFRRIASIYDKERIIRINYVGTF